MRAECKSLAGREGNSSSVMFVLWLGLCVVVLAAQSPPSIEAELESVVSSPSGEEIHMHYANATLAHMPAIVASRVRSLVALYCPHLSENLALFAAEHGLAFGVDNSTLPGAHVLPPPPMQLT